MANRTSFYVITFTDSEGNSQIGRIFERIRNARKNAKEVARYASNVRIMYGGPGGIEVR